MNRPPSRTRALAVLAVLLLTALGLVPLTSSQGSAAPAPRPPAVTGSVATSSGVSVAGLKVRLRAVGRGGPGVVVATATTNNLGQFALVGGGSRTKYYVELLAGIVQRGWAGGDGTRYWQTTVADADKYFGGAHIGKVIGTPSFVRGAVIDSKTGLGVGGVKLTLVPLDGGDNITGITRRNGSFLLSGLKSEDHSLRFKGSGVGYENGVFGCAYVVVPAAEECQTTIGQLPKKIRIDKLARGTSAEARTAAVSPRLAPGLTGRVYDVSNNQPVKGLLVRLVSTTRSGPGRVVDTARTNADGLFSLNGRAGYSYHVQLPRGRYQSGWLGGNPEYFYARFAKAGFYSHRAKLGKVRAYPATISGRLIEQSTGENAPAGVEVTAYRFNQPAVKATATTGSAGRFVLKGINFEKDGYLRFDGSAAGLESGYLTCDFFVSQSFEDACVAPLGVLKSAVLLDDA